MGLFGDLVIDAMGGFPTIPDAPDAPFVDPAQQQIASVKGNQAVLPDLEKLGSEINAYTLRERSKALGAGIPRYGEISKAGSDLALSQLKGEVPADVASQVARRSNANAYSGGYGGSPAADNLSLRDLGLTSLQIQDHGQANAGNWLSMMNNIAVPQQFNVASGFMTPEQHIQAQQWNETNRFNTQWLQNQLDSIPDPGDAAIAKDVGGITDLVATAALAWAGGAIGGMAAGGAGATAGGQLGGAIGGGGGMGGSASQFGGMIGSLMGGSGGGGGGGAPTTPNWGTSYPGSYGGYVPPVQQTVNPYGGGSVYQPQADIYSLGGYAYGTPAATSFY